MLGRSFRRDDAVGVPACRRDDAVGVPAHFGGGFALAGGGSVGPVVVLGLVPHSRAFGSGANWYLGVWGSVALKRAIWAVVRCLRVVGGSRRPRSGERFTSDAM